MIQVESLLLHFFVLAKILLDVQRRYVVLTYFAAKLAVIDLSIILFTCLQRKAGRFYPTRLALNISSVRSGSSPAPLCAPAQQRGYIMVETNYRVYAYTQTNLQVALLGLFTELMYRWATQLYSKKFTRKPLG